MKIVIVGAGEVGRHLSRILSDRGDDVTIIESSDHVAEELDEELDVRVIVGNGASAKFLELADIRDADFFLAMTSHDQLNIVACSLASHLGAKRTIARIHDQVYSDNSSINYREYFGIDFLLNPEALCAVEFAKIIRNPERVAVEDFARGEIEAQQIEVAENSKAAGKTLREIKIPAGMRVGYVKRGGRLKLAAADTLIEAGDIVTILGAPELLAEKRVIFTGSKSDENVGVVIYGATEIGLSLVRLLKNPRYHIKIIEPNKYLARHVAEMFPRASVINGSATSLRLLEEENIGAADYFVACTRDEEENIMTALQAKKLGASHVMLANNKPDYEALMHSMLGVMGFDMLVSPRKTTAAEIVRYISRGSFVKIGTLDEGDVDIIEVRVAESSPLAGKTLREMSLPAGCIIAARMHNASAKVPGPDDIVEVDDRIILILSKSQIAEIVKMFRP